ncbi:cyclin-dependent kinase 20 isoform X1 [Apis mellifera caucasica]|uniref:Cyclin-dependent kinase 20 n=1 Tax=Apis mellifera TaxID=7460 RepID=A0A7M7TG23_APIME|nr:cyclin-dependent kinase 20 isoform X1 [Apis mellifera]KAG6796055.1 cyclin-dependent kinase 20 isoform X1 [Apis mellifera caucasica]KAG9430363.1 cyclin-dependent kinase 20 isoform X1 [Apis mellifera carnica]|eukprot:XP_624845.3 cyclin-dependent kinase 20 isoform X1 [Apis mellifera]
MDRYIITGKIGKGAQGIVLKAHDLETEKNVALKKLFLKNIDNGISTSIIREIKILQQLKHLNIIELLDAFPAGLDFIMVFEYMPTGLWEIIKDNDILLTPVQIKIYIKMILEGIAYIHEKNIIHRDLKPANLLINEKGILKIADFGLGRLLWKNVTKPYSHQIATRWYRAPELLYGARYYTSAIDMWSIGCIFGELLNKSPLFPGETDIEQLAIVLKYLGSPTSETWPDLSILPDYNKITFPYHKGITWEKIIEDSEPEAIDLISKILIYNSSKRLSASEALQHIYFHVKPYTSSKYLIKPQTNHRYQIRQKEINTNIQPTILFKNLLSIT